MNYPNEIRMELFNDLTANPESITHEVTPDGLGKEIRRTPDPQSGVLTIIREIQVTVIMPPAVAEYVGNWLLEQVKLSRGAEK